MPEYIVNYQGYGSITVEAPNAETARDMIWVDLKEINMKVQEMDVEEI